MGLHFEGVVIIKVNTNNITIPTHSLVVVLPVKLKLRLFWIVHKYVVSAIGFKLIPRDSADLLGFVIVTLLIQNEHIDRHN